MIAGATSATATQSSSAQSSTQSAAAAANVSMGKDQFLTLLIEQLKNQDPMNPMQNQDFTAQMAQFSSLEQLFGINDNLGMMMSSMNSANTASALNLIGREVTAAGQNVHVKNGSASDVSFNLPDNATDVTITISDESGNVVKTIEAGRRDAGDQTVSWNPVSDRGADLPDGLYSYTVTAHDAGGEVLDVTTYTKGIVTGVSFEDGVAYVHVGNAKYMLSEITEVNDVNNNTNNSTENQAAA